MILIYFNINHIYTIMVVDKIPTSIQCRSESFFEFGRSMVFVSNILSVCFLQQASLVIQSAFSMNWSRNVTWNQQTIYIDGHLPVKIIWQTDLYPSNLRSQRYHPDEIPQVKVADGKYCHLRHLVMPVMTFFDDIFDGKTWSNDSTNSQCWWKQSMKFWLVVTGTFGLWLSIQLGIS